MSLFINENFFQKKKDERKNFKNCLKSLKSIDNGLEIMYDVNIKGSAKNKGGY